MPRLMEHLENIQELLSLAKASAKIKSITIQEDKIEYDLRPQIHPFLRAPTGSAKSTLLKMVKDAFPEALTIDTATAAGMVGSIDKNRSFVPGAAWEARNKMILLDEFHFLRRSDWVVFLKLLEDQRYSKKTGQFVAEQDLTDDDLYLRVKNGYVDMKTRFTAVMATMRPFEKFYTQHFKALMTRCIPYEYELTLHELEEIAKGAFQFKLKDYYVSKEEIYVHWREYKEIREFVKERMLPTKYCRDNFLRIVGDVTRIHVIHHNLDRPILNNLIWWKLDAYRKIGRYRKERDEQEFER